MRGTRHKQLCGICYSNGATFPGGFYECAWCEQCITDYDITPLNNCPFGRNLQLTLEATYFSPTVAMSGGLDQELSVSHFRSICPSNSTVCVACGCGDNTVGHWTRWCIVPLLASHVLLRPSHPWHVLNDLAIHSSRGAAICTLVIACFRRLLRQQGAFHHQQRSDPKSVWWWCETLVEQVSQDAVKELRVPLLHPVKSHSTCKVTTAGVDTMRVLPTQIESMHLPPIINVSTTTGQAGDLLCVLPTQSLHASIFREMCVTPIEKPRNVRLTMVHCTCGEYHIHVTLLSEIGQGEVLVPSDFGTPRIFCQFDGSAHRAQAVGGAGAALYIISAQGLQLLAWSCISLLGCKDNIVAEAFGADLCLKLYERYVLLCATHSVEPLPLDRIQGDILPLLNHLRFQSRFRRHDLVPVIDRFHSMRSRLAPLSAIEYRPREANFVADYLAGKASALLLAQLKSGESPLQIQEHLVDPPYELLLQNNASILGRHVDGKFVIALRELPDCTFEELSHLVPQVEPHVQRVLCEIALATQKFTHALTVEYVTSAADGAGRVYCRQACAQILPKSVRAFLYARTHQEVDIAGAHYELIRRLSHSTSLPSIEVLRRRLEVAWEGCIPQGGEHIIKLFPIRVINTSAAATIRYLQSHSLPTAGFVSAIALDLEAARDVCVPTVLRSRANIDSTFANRNFFACEYLETKLMCRFVRSLQRNNRCSSIIWLHDGVWISKSITLEDVRIAEREAISYIFPSCPHTEPLFRVRNLVSDYLAASDRFSSVPDVPFVFPSQLVQPKRAVFTRKHPGPLFSDARSHLSDDKTYHDRIKKRSRGV